LPTIFHLARQMRAGLSGLDNVGHSGSGTAVATLALAAFTVEGAPHALMGARLIAQYGIGVHHDCFCAPLA
jgi:selenocysteine lyase/cysteine desulfurase